MPRDAYRNGNGDLVQNASHDIVAPIKLIFAVFAGITKCPDCISLSAPGGCGGYAKWTYFDFDKSVCLCFSGDSCCWMGTITGQTLEVHVASDCSGDACAIYDTWTVKACYSSIPDGGGFTGWTVTIYRDGGIGGVSFTIFEARISATSCADDFSGSGFLSSGDCGATQIGTVVAYGGTVAGTIDGCP